MERIKCTVYNPTSLFPILPKRNESLPTSLKNRRSISKTSAWRQAPCLKDSEANVRFPYTCFLILKDTASGLKMRLESLLEFNLTRKCWTQDVAITQVPLLCLIRWTMIVWWCGRLQSFSLPHFGKKKTLTQLVNSCRRVRYGERVDVA